MENFATALKVRRPQTLRAFRFGAIVSREMNAAQWCRSAADAESMGYSTLLVTDHLHGQLGPFAALTTAASVTTSLRVGTFVLNNDMRHPVIVAKEAATIDVLSGGRMELGLGAGWLPDDYSQTGIAFDRAGVRVERLGEAVDVVRSCFAGKRFRYEGNHYQINGLEGSPAPLQRRIPIHIGGGSKRVLTLAGRQADIVGINFDMRAGASGPASASTGTAAATRQKLCWVFEAAGYRSAELELSVTVYAAIRHADSDRIARALAPGFGVDADEVANMPHVLIGTVDEMVDRLRRRRDELGVSYVVFRGREYRDMAPVVERLAGT